MSTGVMRLSLAAMLLTLVVVVLGAYVRLSDAGLSCPDWPGCYGQIGVPSEVEEVAAAEAAFPGTPVEVGKAWKEMVHRYLAGILGLAILAIAVWSWCRRHEPGMPVVLPWALVGLVVFQALLGMWTVTWLLKPAVVTAHLLGGMATLGVLAWLVLKHLARLRGWQLSGGSALASWSVVALVVLVLQIGLGGWTSANYAALACPDFPLCNGELWPQMDLAEGFQLQRELGRTTSGELVSHEGLVSVHFVHRLGAIVTLVLLVGAAIAALMHGARVTRAAATTVLVLLLVQLGLGIATVLQARPLGYAVAHNGNAALLLLATLLLVCAVRHRR